MKIEAIDEIASYKTDELTNVSFEQLVKAIGFYPNINDDPYKVKYSWAFTVDGVKFAIWDWKGSYRTNKWSVFGNINVIRDLLKEVA